MGAIADVGNGATHAVVTLDDDAASDHGLVGGKARALAALRRHGLPTLPGIVITTAAGAGIGPASQDPALDTVIPAAHARATALGERLVVRSSSVIEDQSASSAAGQFRSEIDVVGADRFDEAVRAVLASGADAGLSPAPMAVLVQPYVDPDVGGVWFGVDPVSGRTDRTVIAAVRGQPGGLVGGEVSGGRWVFDADGSLVGSDDPDGVGLDRGLAAQLHELGVRAGAVFGGPQDIEWAHVDGRLVLLQSRPVTTPIRGVPVGPVFGLGPVAETFPEPLARLEIDLWVPPLREGLHDALSVSGTVSDRRLGASDLVVVVGGRVAVDIEITGDVDPPAGWRHRIGIGRRVRRLRSAWRLGRLRVALPYVVAGLMADIDDDLASVPPLPELTSRQLLALIDRGRDGLQSLHAHEILLGMVTEPAGARFTSASVAMQVLAEARRDGLDDATIATRAPVVLALVPPRVGGGLRFPRDVAPPGRAVGDLEESDAQLRREALRLRVRWLQELIGQAAFELGVRLHRRGVLSGAEEVRERSLGELDALVVGRVQDRAHAESLHRIRVIDTDEPRQNMPARFRISDRGLPIAEPRRDGTGAGTGAGGGVGRGRVTHDVDDPAPGSVLVVSTLRPELGPKLRQLAAIVSETGSVLSHLAILAREHGVAVVVDHDGATQDLREGMVVTVDGDTGHVEIERSDNADARTDEGPAPR